jgi:hypothetical protein
MVTGQEGQGNSIIVTECDKDSTGSRPVDILECRRRISDLIAKGTSIGGEFYNTGCSDRTIFGRKKKYQYLQSVVELAISVF